MLTVRQGFCCLYLVHFKIEGNLRVKAPSDQYVSICEGICEIRVMLSDQYISRFEMRLVLTSICRDMRFVLTSICQDMRLLLTSICQDMRLVLTSICQDLRHIVR